MHSLVKGIILSVWIWFIIKVSEKVSGNTKHQIQNEFLYYFIWLWHSFGADKLLENYEVIMNAIIKAKPAAAKGQYIKSVALTTTMGPSIFINQK